MRLTRRTRALLAPVLLITGVSGMAGNIILNGSGATFPFPLYRKWISVYQGRSNVRITYQGVGSGSGIRNFLQKSVDFGATDAFLTDEESNRSGQTVLHIPTCLGAVVVTYKLPGSPQLQITPEILTSLFLGEIKRWSDPRITECNGGNPLPDIPVILVHRSESSGTTFLFTDYLSRVSPRWRKRIGCGKVVRWPSGMGVEGNPAMVEMIQRVNGSVGYVELTYAQSQKLPMAAIRNRAGHFIEPGLGSVTASADVEIPPDTRILLTDSPVQNGYPISAFTYLLVYREQNYNGRTLDRARALAEFLWWVVHDGQDYTRGMGYAPLPEAAVKRAEQVLRSMTFDNRPILNTEAF